MVGKYPAWRVFLHFVFHLIYYFNWLYMYTFGFVWKNTPRPITDSLSKLRSHPMFFGALKSFSVSFDISCLPSILPPFANIPYNFAMPLAVPCPCDDDIATSRLYGSLVICKKFLKETSKYVFCQTFIKGYLI